VALLQMASDKKRGEEEIQRQLLFRLSKGELVQKYSAQCFFLKKQIAFTHVKIKNVIEHSW
jgi:hypothetical protein